MLPIVSIGLSLLLYLITGINNIYQKDYPHALVWISYAAANAGFLWYEIIKYFNSNI